MTTVTQRPSNASPTPAATRGLRVSAYENVAGMLLALLLLVGGLVGLLLTVWLSNRVFTYTPTVPVTLIEDVGGGREDGVVGESMELNGPEAEEVSRETGLGAPQMQSTLALVADAIAVRQADLDDPVISDEVDPGTSGRLQGDGRQVAYGAGSGPPGIPRFKRWEIFFPEGSTLDVYARQLDFFHIELGVVSSQQQVTYVSNLSARAPQRRTGPRADEKRLYMSWRQGSLKNADRNLLTRAGVNPGDGLVLQFYPADIENRLAQMEVAFAKREPKQIRKTRFGIQPRGDAYEFYVIDQTPL